MNDLQFVINAEEIKLFADDTAIFMEGNDINMLLAEAKTKMTKINEWFVTNKLSLSFDKSNFVIFRSKKKKLPNNPDIDIISFGNHTIQRTAYCKYIGVTIDETLSWNQHVETILKALQKYYGIFYNIRKFISVHTARSIYFSVIYPRISLWT